jgi:hypothetical protein
LEAQRSLYRNAHRTNYKMSDKNFGVLPQSLEADSQQICSTEWCQLPGHRLREEFRGVSRYLCANVLTLYYTRLVPLFISLLQLIYISRVFRCLFVESQSYIAVYIQISLL